MKRLFPVIAMIMLFFTSCTFGNNLSSKKEGEGYIPQCHNAQDQLFSKLKEAINSGNISDIKAIFSITTQNYTDINKSAEELIDYIEGDVSDILSDVGELTFYYEDEAVILQQSTYFTSENGQKYKVAIRSCIEDNNNKANVGVISFYIIKAEEHQWLTYLGDEKWTPGINIGKQ